jgi:thymidylate synthase
MDFALKRHVVEARDLPDLWFQAIHDIFEHGRRFVIDCGSYAGQTRLEYDYFTGHVAHPGAQPLIPEIPPNIDVPAPVEEAYIYGGEGYEHSYLEYLMTPHKEPGEDYTYGERLCAGAILYDKIYAPYDIYGGEINQIEHVIATYKKYGFRNNQMVLQIAQPGDLLLNDPPCLRSIDTRIQDNKLHFFVYFRSWDLWGGLPANLAGIQNLKEYMAAEIGVEDGEMIVESKGLHLYGYAEELGKIRCMMED